MFHIIGYFAASFLLNCFLRKDKQRRSLFDAFFTLPLKGSIYIYLFLNLVLCKLHLPNGLHVNLDNFIFN